jgi:hypothetical protein
MEDQNFAYANQTSRPWPGISFFATANFLTFLGFPAISYVCLFVPILSKSDSQVRESQ